MTTEAQDQRGDQPVADSEEPPLTPIERINQIIDDAFSQIPDEEWSKIEPDLVRWLNEKCGIDRAPEPR